MCSGKELGNLCFRSIFILGNNLQSRTLSLNVLFIPPQNLKMKVKKTQMTTKKLDQPWRWLSLHQVTAIKRSGSWETSYITWLVAAFQGPYVVVQRPLNWSSGKTIEFRFRKSGYFSLLPLRKSLKSKISIYIPALQILLKIGKWKWRWHWGPCRIVPGIGPTSDG